MARAIIAALCATASQSVISVFIDNCVEADESSLLQRHLTFSTPALAGAQEFSTFAESDMLANARRLVEEIEQKEEDVGGASADASADYSAHGQADAPAPTSAMTQGTAGEVSIEASATTWFRAQLASWSLSATKVGFILLSPRHRSTATLSLIGVGVGAKTSASAEGHETTSGQSVAVMIVLPLLALGIALLVSVSFAPPRQYSRAGSHATDDLLSPIGAFRANLSTGEVYARGRGSLRPSLASPGKERASLPVGLCPELNVPPGNECILGIPSLACVVPGGTMLERITDGAGRPLLSVGLSNGPTDGDCIMLAKKGQSELGYCEVAGAAEGWSAKIFRWNGELFAHLREAHADDLRRLAASESSSQSNPSSNTVHHQKTFIIQSSHGPPWELRVKGNFKEWNLFVEDSLRQVKAMVYPGPDPSSAESGSGSYRLRLGPRADSCTVILALLTIERILVRKGQLPTKLRRSVTSRDYALV